LLCTSPIQWQPDPAVASVLYKAESKKQPSSALLRSISLTVVFSRCHSWVMVLVYVGPRGTKMQIGFTDPDATRARTRDPQQHHLALNTNTLALWANSGCDVRRTVQCCINHNTILHLHLQQSNFNRCMNSTALCYCFSSPRLENNADTSPPSCLLTEETEITLQWSPTGHNPRLGKGYNVE
jgi:hypothetical protein